ncbi:hypothetical protein E5Q_01390 [Mixia osmundae IAM 14324]|uniref:Uncharacterized protein n=1 Tax=Mixia osmundae (strain CBS 9802 / IAM 14324 / JCM 22182 / KY 12970) TaxID=764103 RepID=G7DVX6_MIXOS|nr:hypothetical protein E5Q_01390 [Mixia osmundae IAM 14324]
MSNLHPSATEYGSLPPLYYRKARQPATRQLVTKV